MANQWVVPYNPWIASKYNAVINVESRSAVSATAYLYRYFYKWPWWAAVGFGNGEISAYLDGIRFSSQGDFWRLLGFDLRCSSPSLARLHVRLSDEHPVVLLDAELITDIASRPSRKTTMAGRLVANSEYPEIARGIRYRTHPSIRLGY